jgi:hypothetical protein
MISIDLSSVINTVDANSKARSSPSDPTTEGTDQLTLSPISGIHAGAFLVMIALHLSPSSLLLYFLFCLSLLLSHSSVSSRVISLLVKLLHLVISISFMNPLPLVISICTLLTFFLFSLPLLSFLTITSFFFLLPLLYLFSYPFLLPFPSYCYAFSNYRRCERIADNL